MPSPSTLPEFSSRCHPNEYYAQPDYNARQVQIYALPTGSPATLQTTVSLSSSNQGPNDVVLYETPTSSKLFVSYDFGSSGLVEIYDFANDILPHLGTASISPTPVASIPVATSVVGMAIQPGTGNLFCATFNESETLATEPHLTGNGGVIVFSAPGYLPATATQFSDNSDNSVTRYCANLAFDESGNLWMTTWDDLNTIDGGVGDQFLVCYLAVNGMLSKETFFIIGNLLTDGEGNSHEVTFSSRVVKLPPSPQGPPASLYAFSSPEGIAFDPNGNLWLGNNNDYIHPNGVNNGTLVRIDQAWIAANILNYTSIQAAIAAGANGVPLSFAIDATHYANNLLITVYFLYGGKFGNLVFDGTTLYVHDQDNGGTADAVVWSFDTTTYAASPVTFTKTAIATDYPGNGGSFLFNTKPAQLLIRDTLTDTGAEPDSGAAGVLWESPDIAVSEQGSTPALPAPNQPVDPSVVLGSGSINHGTPANVVVRIQNVSSGDGSSSSTGTEIVKVFYAKASAGLSWPVPWTGGVFDTTPSNPPLGGFIGAATIGVIDPGKESFLTIPWNNPPDSAAYSVNDEHFCLIARIESASVYPYGMDVPEETNLSGSATTLGDNVGGNRAIGWRNIAIIASKAPKRTPPHIHLGVLGANYGFSGPIHIKVTTFGGDGDPLPTQPKIHIRGSGPVWRRCWFERLLPAGLLHLFEEVFEILDPLLGFGPIHLNPHERLPLSLEIVPPPGIEDFAVRVTQVAMVKGVEAIVGGQTFVVGTVKGFPVIA